MVLAEAQSRYGLELIGFAEECRDRYYAVTAERRITHPAVANLTAGAAQLLKP